MPCLFAESGMMPSSLVSNSIEKVSGLLENQSIRYASVSDVSKSLRVYIWPILIATILYLPICWILKALYKDRKPFPYKSPVIAWNLALSLLSALGSLICIVYQPSILLGKFDPSVPYSVNETGVVGVHPYVALVVRIFCITKVIEYGDTFWLCVKKRPTIFLHLYHHITVSLYCLHSVLMDCPFGHFFAFVNLNVHAVMYGYYAAAIMFKGNKTLTSMRPFITLGQLLQMFFGIAFCTYELISANFSFGLEINAFFGFLMYVSYAYLFGDFFIKNYKKNLSSVYTLCALTPISFFPLLCYGIGWLEMLYNPWTTFVSCVLCALIARLSSIPLMSVISPIFYSGIESKAHGVSADAVRCMAKLNIVDGCSDLAVVIRFSMLPVVAVLIDSIVTTYFTLRSLPLISLAWVAHGYLGGAFEVQKALKKVESKPVVAEECVSEVKMVESVVGNEPEELRRRSTSRVVQ